MASSASLKVEPRVLQQGSRKAAMSSRADSPTGFMAELGKARSEIAPKPPRAVEKPERPEPAEPSSKKKATDAPERRRGAVDEKPEDVTTELTAEAPVDDEVAVESTEDATVEPEAETAEGDETESDEESDEPNVAAAQLAIAATTPNQTAQQDVTEDQGDGDGEAALTEGAIEAIFGDGASDTAEAGVDESATTDGIALPEEFAAVTSDETADEDVVATVNANRGRGTRGDEEAETSDEGAETIAAQLAAVPDAAADATGQLTGTDATHANAKLVADSTVAVASMVNAAASHQPTAAVDPKAMPAIQQLPSELQFAQANHEKIVTGMQGQLLPNGGSMQIRLDPPHLGPLQVSVHLRDGVMTASFETQNDDATRLLSHSLSQLKTSLESQGITVDRLQVQQAPKSQDANTGQNDAREGQQQGAREGLTEQQQQKQRQEMLKRMWQRLAGDPLDLVA